MADVDIFVGNNTIIDPDVYHFWLCGYTVHETASFLQKKGVLKQYGATFDMLFSDTSDHYRTYSMMERFLQNPPKLTDQLTFQLAPEHIKLLIEKYYEFDQIVIREILGKKLSSRNRNSLDDVSEKTKIPIRSCRRQFDNIKRVFKVVEEMKGHLVENIKIHFLLPEPLAIQYAAIVFIANNRFETGKKKMLYLTFEDFVICANLMITNWSYSSKACQNHEDMDVDFDREFLQGLRDLKVICDKDTLDEHKKLVLKLVEGKLSGAATIDLKDNFKNYSKSIVNIANGLNHSKEMRDLFVDLVEKLVEPFKQGNWNKQDVQVFFKEYTETSMGFDFSSRSNPNLVKVWERYTETVTACIIQMYHP